MKRGRKALAAEKEDRGGALAAFAGRNPEAFHLAIVLKGLRECYALGNDFIPPLEKFVEHVRLEIGEPKANVQAGVFLRHALWFAQDLFELTGSGSDALASMLEDVAVVLRRDRSIADPFRHFLPMVLKQLYGPAPGTVVVIPNDVLDLLRRYDVSVHERTVRKEVLKLGYKLRAPGRP